LKNFRSSGIYAGERGCQAYEMLVAKLAKLEIVDGCAVTAKERKNCEFFFLNRFYQQPILDVHRADLERLVKIHGEPVLQALNGHDTNSLQFVLVYGERRIERTLLLNLTIQKLVTLASRLFEFEPSDVCVCIQVFDDNFETLPWNSSTVLRAFEPQPSCILKFISPVDKE
jgi:hypothetical protein